ncbi:Bsp6I family type II restriction endonuclease [Bacillus basilensis]|uniref:Bsp6I family type II restriction endonuclease n=1 Tax=Bacillus basilensis TaxID=3243721 RepID=UPI003D64CA61
MKKDTIEINGASVEVIIYDKNDRESFKDIYNSWRNLSNQLDTMGARRIAFPNEIAEGLFCLEMNAVKPRKGHFRFDCFIPENNKRIEIKVTSSLPDFTVIRPDKDDWDEFYFMDFYVNGDWDGTFKIFLIEKELLYKNLNWNSSRPKVSIYRDIIQKYEIQPAVTAKI